VSTIYLPDVRSGAWKSAISEEVLSLLGLFLNRCVEYSSIDGRIILYRKDLGTRPGLYVFRYRVGGITVRSQSAQNIRGTGQTATSGTSYTDLSLPLHRRRFYYYILVFKVKWFWTLKGLTSGKWPVLSLTGLLARATLTAISGIGVPRVHIMTAVI
jgi:hypothetical protein